MPIESFFKRTWIKWKQITKSLGSHFGIIVGLTGARPIGSVQYGNGQLRLNKDYALGKRGTIVQVPKDRVIYSYVKHSGEWELEESKFLASALIDAKDLDTAFVDIGANSGLVSLQALNLSDSKADVFLVEPIKRHVQALLHNFSTRKINKVHVGEFALSDRNGVDAMQTEIGNSGNSSLVPTAIPKKMIESSQVILKDTKQYCEENLLHFERIVIKSDAQGMDALILARVPRSIWDKCSAACVEIWSLPEVHELDVDKCLKIWQGFKHASYTYDSDCNKDVPLSSIREFWLSKSGEFRNLFLRR